MRVCLVLVVAALIGFSTSAPAFETEDGSIYMGNMAFKDGTVSEEVPRDLVNGGGAEDIGEEEVQRGPKVNGGFALNVMPVSVGETRVANADCAGYVVDGKCMRPLPKRSRIASIKDNMLSPEQQTVGQYEPDIHQIVQQHFHQNVMENTAVDTHLDGMPGHALMRAEMNKEDESHAQEMSDSMFPVGSEMMTRDDSEEVVTMSHNMNRRGQQPPKPVHPSPHTTLAAKKPRAGVMPAMAGMPPAADGHVDEYKPAAPTDQSGPVSDSNPLPPGASASLSPTTPTTTDTTAPTTDTTTTPTTTTTTETATSLPTSEMMPTPTSDATDNDSVDGDDTMGLGEDVPVSDDVLVRVERDVDAEAPVLSENGQEIAEEEPSANADVLEEIGDLETTLPKTEVAPEMELPPTPTPQPTPDPAVEEAKKEAERKQREAVATCRAMVEAEGYTCQQSTDDMQLAQLAAVVAAPKLDASDLKGSMLALVSHCTGEATQQFQASLTSGGSNSALFSQKLAKYAATVDCTSSQSFPACLPEDAAKLVQTTPTDANWSCF